MKKNSHYDVAIIGGGLVGMTTATALGSLGLTVALIERDAYEFDIKKNTTSPSSKASSDGEEEILDGRCSAIAQGSARFMKTIGLWDALIDDAEPLTHIRVSDRDSLMHLDYHDYEVGAGPLGYMITNTAMRRALQQAVLSHENITCLTSAEWSAIKHEEAHVCIQCENNTEVTASLLIAADGKFSAVRAQYDIPCVTKNYQQNGIVCTISHEKHHLGTAQERFLDAGPFAVLPMKGGYHSSLVWVEPSDYVDLYMKMSDEDLSEEVARRIGGDYLGQVSVTGKRFSYPLSMVHAQRYHDKRLIIIGDAAHGMHPLAGQGFNVGIRDAQALHGLIQEQREWGGDIGSLSFLERYTRARNFDASSMIAATDGLDALFSTSSYPIALARRFGMKTLNHVPAVKKYFIRQAMGINQ